MHTTKGDTNDDLYQDAVQFVIEKNTTSTAALQRNFRIGYNRAARLLQAMEGEGFLSASNEMGKREIIKKTKSIYTCEAFHKLQKAADDDIARDSAHDCRGKIEWIVDRAMHYAEKTKLDAADILTAWESSRKYWYMNYYQEANQPLIEGDNVRVFEDIQNLRDSVADKGFRCPACNHISNDSSACDSPECDWKAYGLFKCLGKGAIVFVKSEMKIAEIFMPVAWEQ